MGQAATGRRQQNKLEKRARITAAARALFTHKGYEATTTQEIAEAAGVAAGTIFIYAKTKEALLTLVFHDEIMDLVVSAHAEAKDLPLVADRIIAFLDCLVRYHERDIELARVLIRQLGSAVSDDQKEIAAQPLTTVLARLTLLIEAAKADGQVDPVHPSFVAARVLFGIYYLHLGGFLNGHITRQQFDRNLRQDVGLFLTGLAAPDANETMGGEKS
ncbi:TetR/AcrR family transcriptional regulator [Parasphingorhabdus sp.]|uniref:TetR/AcrR family transcriptional regulator n=1 Tax=Parasphingorhabdus sp. TaxID=2709688 RepID=UPI003BB15DF9